MDPSYAQRYRDLAVRHWWWRARNDAVRDEIARLMDGRRGARVLDIGCGDGVLFPFLANYGSVDGIEPDATVVSATSPWRDRIAIRPFDATFRPDRPYDLVLMLDVLEHFEDPAETLRLVAGLLAPDARVIVTVPAFRSLWTHHDDLNHHFHRFSTGQLDQVARTAGLAVDRSWYMFQWLVGAKLAQRARERVLGPAPPETVPPSAINEALYRVCRVERQIAGRRVPFGSSVIAVLRRAGQGAA